MCITATNPSDHWSNKKDFDSCIMVLPQAFCSGPRALPYPVAPCKEVARRSPRLSVPLARSEDPLGAPPPGDMGNRWHSAWKGSNWTASVSLWLFCSAGVQCCQASDPEQRVEELNWPETVGNLVNKYSMRVKWKGRMLCKDGRERTIKHICIHYT